MSRQAGHVRHCTCKTRGHLCVLRHPPALASDTTTCRTHFHPMLQTGYQWRLQYPLYTAGSTRCKLFLPDLRKVVRAPSICLCGLISLCTSFSCLKYNHIPLRRLVHLDSRSEIDTDILPWSFRATRFHVADQPWWTLNPSLPSSAGLGLRSLSYPEL